MADQSRYMTPRTIITIIIFIIIVPFLPLIISRQWNWWEAWIYAIIYIAGFAISRGIAGHRHPDLLSERARFMQHEDAKSWDRVLSPIVGFGGVLILVVVGLDALYNWSPPFSLPVKILALILILIGYALGSYALIENRFFSGMVRIQYDRDHTVVSSGPYRWIRHPGYTGAMITYLATPFFLDSIWALLPTMFITAVLVIRTSLEDQVLQDELDGYRDYSANVRYRLIPGLW